jgi:hypothetical protein
MLLAVAACSSVAPRRTAGGAGGGAEEPALELGAVPNVEAPGSGDRGESESAEDGLSPSRDRVADLPVAPPLKPIVNRCPKVDKRAASCVDDPNSARCAACYDERSPTCDRIACRVESQALLACARANNCMSAEGWVDWACGTEHCDRGSAGLLSSYVSCFSQCPYLEPCASTEEARCCGLDTHMGRVMHSAVCDGGVCEHEYMRVDADGRVEQTFVTSAGEIDVTRPFARMDRVRVARSYRGVWKTDCNYLEIVGCGARREKRDYRYDGAGLRTATYDDGNSLPRAGRTFLSVKARFPVAPEGWDADCDDK